MDTRLPVTMMKQVLVDQRRVVEWQLVNEIVILKKRLNLSSCRRHTKRFGQNNETSMHRYKRTLSHDSLETANRF